MRFSALAVSDSLEQLAVPRWYKKNVLADVKVLGVQGETVSRSSPETRLALSALLVVSAWARVRSLFLILISRPNAFKYCTHITFYMFGNLLYRPHLSVKL